MRQSILQRFLHASVVLIGVVLLTFVMLRIVPGNPIETMMGEHADAETVARMTAEMGLEKPGTCISSLGFAIKPLGFA